MGMPLVAANSCPLVIVKELFQRKFMKGATHVELDGAGRMNIPALLLEHAGIELPNDNEIIVSGLGEKIEVWSKTRYDLNVLDDVEDFDFGSLAEDVRKDIEPSNEN